MARTGFSTANYLSNTTIPFSAAPATIAAWVYKTSTAIGGVAGVTKNSNNATFRVYVDASSKVVATHYNGTTVGAAVTTASVSTNTWTHVAAVFNTTASRSAFLNGANKVTNTTSVTGALTFDRTLLGALGNTSSVGSPLAGYLAEVAMWDIALSDADIAVLATGVSPLAMHPEAIVAYWPLVGGNSPETNVVSTATLTITGSLSAAAHPRIIMPSRQGIIV